VEPEGSIPGLKHASLGRQQRKSKAKSFWGRGKALLGPGAVVSAKLVVLQAKTSLTMPISS
jgi:hypothetical protein